MDFSKLLDVISTVTKIVVPGVSEAVAAGEAVIALAKSVHSTLTSQDQAALQAALTPLMAKMNMDVNAAIAALRGTG